MSVRDPIVNSLQASVHRRLDEIESAVRENADVVPTTAVTLSDTARMVETVRALLALHRVDVSGHCEVCHGRRRRLFTRRSHRPCRAYLAASLTLGEHSGRDDLTAPPRHARVVDEIRHAG